MGEWADRVLEQEMNLELDTSDYDDPSPDPVEDKMAAIKGTNYELMKAVASGRCDSNMKVVIDWFFDDDVLVHSIYVNGKKFRYGSVVDVQASTLIFTMQDFADAVGIELEVNKHNWDSVMQPDPIDTSSELEINLSGW